MINQDNHLRSITFHPYLRGKGPTFTLHMWDTFKLEKNGKSRIGFRLVMNEPNRPRKIIFEGDEFYPSPFHAVDSDNTVASLMSFLCLRPGDTDSEYFSSYTAEQLDFCEQHAEYLGFEAYTLLEKMQRSA